MRSTKRRAYGKVWQPEEEPRRPMVEWFNMWDNMSIELGSAYHHLKSNDKMRLQEAIQRSQ